MKLDTGVVVTIAAILLFYLRLMALQWGKAKRYRAYQNRIAQEDKNGGKKGKKKSSVVREAPKMSFEVANWYLVAAGVVAIIVGVLFNWVPGLDANVRSFWWAPLCIGVGFFTFSFR
jgi:hypothetical protein